MEYVQMTLDDWLRMKQSIEDDLRSLSEGFVRVGYKLRQVRDQELYRHDGYDTIAEWARAEYGLNASTVSRFIAINQKYSVDGNSDRLRPEFGKLGQSKLAEMLTLPDSDLQMVEPAMSRDGIQELKQFNRAAPDKGIADDLYQLIERFWEDNPDLKSDYAALIDAGYIDLDEAKETVNPSGSRTYRKGLYIMMMYEDSIRIKKFGGEPDTLEWSEFFRVSGLIFQEAEQAAGAEESAREPEESARKPEESVQKPEQNARKPEETAQEPRGEEIEKPEGEDEKEAEGAVADDRDPEDPVSGDPGGLVCGEDQEEPAESGDVHGEEQESKGESHDADRGVAEETEAVNEDAEEIAPAQLAGVEASIHIILDNLQKAVSVKAYKSALHSAENLVDQLRKLVEGGDSDTDQ